ncbi:hypothetical protein GCM10009628_01920 [Paeniglutamicibacter kerguelensis]
MVEGFNELRAGGGAAGDFVFEDPAASGGFEGVPLELGVLSVGGDAGVADEIDVIFSKASAPNSNGYCVGAPAATVAGTHR